MCEAISVFPKGRLAFASCTLVLILAYVAWHDQQRARTVSGPKPPAGFELASGPQLAAAPQPEAQSAFQPLPATEPELAPSPQVAAGSQSVLDPRPWSPGPAVPELQPPPPPVQTEEETAAEARSTPEPRGGTVAPVVQSSAMMQGTAIAAGPAEITPIPLPRPRPRKPPALGLGTPPARH